VLLDTLRGYNGTILAYGQTGSGKTHTLLNTGGSSSDAGLVPRVCSALFYEIANDLESAYSVEAAFMQIYNEQVCADGCRVCQERSSAAGRGVARLRALHRWTISSREVARSRSAKVASTACTSKA
jgi:kinesin family protein 5